MLDGQIRALGAQHGKELVDTTHEIRVRAVRPHGGGHERRRQHLVQQPDRIVDTMRERHEVPTRIGFVLRQRNGRAQRHERARSIADRVSDHLRHLL